jgi:AdoMet-dependent heme synthase
MLKSSPQDESAKMKETEVTKNINLETSTLQKKDSANIPILRSFIVLRRESFGGYFFNPYLPPEAKFDQLRFKIAALCDGSHTIEEIKEIVGQSLEHSEAYIDLLVEGVLKNLSEQFAICWRKEKLSAKKDFQLQDSYMNKYSGNTLSAPLFVIWEITSRCNLKCEHCLSDAGKPDLNELNTNEAKAIIDTLSEMKVFTIAFSGGEPLTRPDIFELLQYASEKNIGIDLLTNGGLISKETVEKLDDTNIFNVQVSVDGIEETHDNFRGCRGSYKQALKAIELLIEKKYNVAINSVVTKQNMDEIPKIIDMAVGLGVKGYKTTLFMPAGRGKSNLDKLVLSPTDVKKFALMIAEKKKEVGNKISISIETEYPWMKNTGGTEAESKITENKTANVGCTAGSSSLYITSNGKIAPCPFLRQIIAGDVRKDDIKQIWGSPELNIFNNLKGSDLKGKCHNCECLGVSCNGGCRAAALAHTGDIHAEDPTCWKHLA